jgi:hypothetical protein
MLTPVVSARYAPVIVIDEPPAIPPALGVMELTDAGIYVNVCGAVYVPAAVVTSTVAGPRIPAGVVAVTVVSELAVTLVANTPPTVTRVVGVPMYAPVIVIAVPPTKHPSVGVMPLIDAGHGPQLESRSPRSLPLMIPSPLTSDAIENGSDVRGPQYESIAPRSAPLTIPFAKMSPVHDCAAAGSVSARAAAMASWRMGRFMVSLCWCE